MVSARFEIVSDKADAVEVGAHGELFIFNLWLACASKLLGERLVVQGKREDDVASYLSSMQGGVKAPQLHRSMSVEEGVQVKEVVAAIVVAPCSVSTVGFVPDGFYLLKRSGLFTVHLLYQRFV